MVQPLFSIIIPTRNRPAPFTVAFQSVLEQRCRNFEVIIVNDGSTEKHERRYRELFGLAPGLARMLTLARTERGHGPSYARNYGAAHARGEYLGFLDDDDQWTDANHLYRAAEVITRNSEPVSLILSNQMAFQQGVPIERAIWIEDLGSRLYSRPDATGAYTVTPAELLMCAAHCHLNAIIVSRAFYSRLGGLDDGLRYEEDRDFFLRAIDRAPLIKFFPQVISRHNIPDISREASASTSESELSKRLYQLRVFDKAVLFSARPEVRRYAMLQRVHTLKHIALEAARMGRLECALHYARGALIAKPGLRWLGLTVLFGLRCFAVSRRVRLSHREPRTCN